MPLDLLNQAREKVLVAGGPEMVNAFRAVARAYALALKKSSGRPVTEAVFLFLQPQMEVAVEDLDGAMADAGRAAVV